MWINPLEYESVLYVADRMRRKDREEIAATREPFDTVALTRDCLAIPHFAWVTGREEAPIAVVGAVPLHPGVWSCWMFATDEFPKIRIGMTKFARHVIVPALAQSGCRRAQCLSDEGHVEAHEWLKALGAVEESRMLGYGKSGETFICFVLMLGLGAQHVHLRRGRRLSGQ